MAADDRCVKKLKKARAALDDLNVLWELVDEWHSLATSLVGVDFRSFDERTCQEPCFPDAASCCPLSRLCYKPFRNERPCRL